MSAVLIRVLLFLLPVLVTVFWLRKRAIAAHRGEDVDQEFSEIRFILLAVLGGVVALVLALYFFDDDRCAPDQRYIAAKWQDGDLIEARCVPRLETGSSE